MNFNGIGKSNSTSASNFLAPKVGKVDSEAVGGKTGAEAAHAVAPAEIPKIAHEIAQSLSSAADKFKQLAGINPFSQKAGLMMDMFAKGNQALKEAVDSWGESIRAEAEANKQADISRQIQMQQLQLTPADRNRAE